MQAAYTYNPRKSEYWARMDPGTRYETALDQVEQLHPQVRLHAGAFTSVAWERMNHHLGCVSLWSQEARDRYFRYIQQPLHGRHLMMGDQMSYHPGWQEGALSSAHHALGELARAVSPSPDGSRAAIGESS